MLETHQRLHEARKSERATRSTRWPIAIAAEAKLLAFDEMIVNNPADAMILSRLFEKLLEPRRQRLSPPPTARPVDLYKGGLNRELFLPFIDLSAGGWRSSRSMADRLPARPPGRRRGVARPQRPRGTRAFSTAFFKLTDYAVEDRAKVPSEELDVGGGRTCTCPRA